MPFFYRFSRKIGCSHTHILSKIRLFSKKHTALKSMFCQKNVHSLKNTVLSCHFFSSFSWKTPRCQDHIWSKKRYFCENYTIIWAQKVNRMPFFPIFHWKVTSLMPILCKKNVHYLKTHCFHAHIFCQKNVHSLKKHCSHIIFSNFSWKTRRPVKPIFGLKTLILSKLHYIMGQKSQRDAFFSGLSRKITSLMPIFCKKTSIF